MKKRILVLFALLLLLSGCGNKKPESKSGWSYTSQGTYYLDEYETPLTGWQVIDGNHYYFHPDLGGAMVVGWLALPEECDPGGRYYFDSTGIMQTGWLQDAGKQYYLRPNGAMAVGTVNIAGRNYHFTSAGEPFLLINLENALPDDYQLDLVEVEGFWVSKECAGALLAMLEDCRAAGYQYQIRYAYRDRELQQTLWDNRYNNYIAQGYTPATATELTAQFVLPPGYSEHHTGLAVDINGTEQMYRWLEEHAPEYGFILRYPADKTHWTGVSYEPWHFRYVGLELALELQALDFTPEEYLFFLTESNRFTG